ncbi:MAG TPA: calcium-binding protein [Solirubrobacterales bacterium]|nr:calcium-binding protein [Solirubrobacterales bacterium]
MKVIGRGLAIAAAAIAAAVFIAAAPAEKEETPRCHGRRAKIVGTEGPDVIRGTPGRDVIWGGGGDDEILGSLGNDLLCGGPGDDLIHGGRGNDVADGGAGTDRVIGDLGDDKILGGAGNADEVAGSLGIDTLNGGPGEFDLVHGDYGYDRMDGGPGKGDIASFATAVAGGKGDGVWASLQAHKARGDGHDRLYRLESIEGSAFRDTLIGSKGNNTINGGPGDDTIRGGGGVDDLVGGQGSDGCTGAKGRTVSCGKEAPPKASAYIQVDRTKGAGGGLSIVGGAGPDVFTVSFDKASESFGISAAKGVAIGAGCTRPGGDPKQVVCATEGPARWLMADLGPGNDRFTVEGSLQAAANVRIAGGFGNDVIKAGPEDDLLESGPGADRLYGGDGADGLVGGLPGPTFLYGEGNGDLLAAGGGCAGGAIVGGAGRDDASFAETDAHPGILYISFPQHKAWIDVVKGCHPVRLDPSDEDMEGSFDNDVLIGDGGPNAMLGQPGKDSFYGNGGEDTIDARDGVRDFVIQCGAGAYVRPPSSSKGKRAEPVLHGTPAGRALTDSFDPSPVLCADVVHGAPVAGLNNGG